MTTIERFSAIPGAAGELETFVMENCRLMLLSSRQNGSNSAIVEDDIGRIFSCKTCGKKFSSFQALGGHRASHKKIKPAENSGESNLPAKPKVHTCLICGVEFPIGQALGGHMRRHRGILAAVKVAVGGDDESATVSNVTTEGSIEISHGSHNDADKIKRKWNDDVLETPILKKPSCFKRVCLDLNLSLSMCEKNEEKEEDDVDEYETVEQGVKEEHDFLKLELGLPSYRFN
ncbi:unnamed protein product [Amaranthus hypochondriacus]